MDYGEKEELSSNESCENTSLKRADSAAALTYMERNAVHQEGLTRRHDWVSHPLVGENRCVCYRVGEALNQNYLN